MGIYKKTNSKPGDPPFFASLWQKGKSFYNKVVGNPPEGYEESKEYVNPDGSPVYVKIGNTTTSTTVPKNSTPKNSIMTFGASSSKTHNPSTTQATTTTTQTVPKKNTVVTKESKNKGITLTAPLVPGRREYDEMFSVDPMVPKSVDTNISDEGIDVLTGEYNLVDRKDRPLSIDFLNEMAEKKKPDFLTELTNANDEYYKDAKGFVVGKAITDAAGTLGSLLQNMNAPLPDTQTPPVVRVPDIKDNSSNSLIALKGSAAEQYALMREVSRALNKPELMVGVDANISSNVGKGILDISNKKIDLINTKNVNETAALNEQEKINAEYRKINSEAIAKDNLTRSEIMSKMLSQLGSIGTQAGNSLLKIKGMKNQDVLYKGLIKQAIEANDIESLSKIVGEYTNWRNGSVPSTTSTQEQID